MDAQPPALPSLSPDVQELRRQWDAQIPWSYVEVDALAAATAASARWPRLAEALKLIEGDAHGPA